MKATSWAVGTALLASLMALLAVIFGTRIDNRLEVWLDHESVAYQHYETFRQHFGNEEFLLVVYGWPENVDLLFLERLTDLRFELEELSGVRRVVDLAGVYSKLFSQRGLESFSADLESSTFLRGFLISSDQRLAATWVHLESSDTVDRTRLVSQVEEVIRTLPQDDVLSPESIHLAGSPVLNVALDRSSREAARTFFPLVFLLSAVALFVLFRRLSGVLIPLTTVGVGILWTLAVPVFTGNALNMVTVALPPLVWVLGLSTAIHLLSRWYEAMAQGKNSQQAARFAVSTLLRPCLYSALTTALGFASLMASSMAPVREMGAFAALGILFCFASNFLLFPILVSIGERFSCADRVPIAGFFPILMMRASQKPRLLLAGSVALCLAFVLGIPYLEAESNPIEFFRDDTPIAVTYRQILPNFTGPYSLEVTVEPPLDSPLDAPRPTAAVSPQSLQQLDRLRGFLESQDGVARALSVVDLVKRAHQESSGDYRLPETEADQADAWRLIEGQPGEDLAVFQARGNSGVSATLRMTVLAQPMGSKAHRRLTEEVKHYLDTEMDPSWRPRLTGLVPLLVDMQDRLVESQVQTFTLTFVIVIGVLGLLLRSLKDALLSLLPNLLPIAFALGTMGWLGIALDPATVMIAGIALGIAVDDTIHFLIAYRRQRQAEQNGRQAIEVALQLVGPPMIVTTLVASLGFLVLCFSAFVPLFHFGLLTAVTLGAALIGDLVVLPALLLIWD